MKFDKNRFNQLMNDIVTSLWRYPDELVIGEDISDYKGVKVIFNNFGWNETSQKYDDESIEEYLIFIHKDSGIDGFEFPEHEASPFGIVHRPKQEVAVRAWFYKNTERSEQEVEDDENEGVWEIGDIETAITEFSSNQTMEIVEKFASRYSI